MKNEISPTFPAGTPTRVECGLRKGVVSPPASKSHLHRLLIADFLAGDVSRLAASPGEPEDIKATKRCLAALADGGKGDVVLDCGESGSTMRFLAPIAAALGRKASFKKAGRLAERPALEYDGISSGTFTLEGNVSSQFVTGLLFALPLVEGDSTILFSSPLESQGYVEMTLDVLRGAGIEIRRTAGGGFEIPGGQKYSAQPGVEPETDWSGAAFWICANSFGNEIEARGLNPRSLQPDAAAMGALEKIGGEIDVSQFPDSFPALAVAAAAFPAATRFTGTRRLRIKESDRTAAMADVLGRLGVGTEADDSSFTVFGTDGKFNAGKFASFGDHRIAMAIAIAATRAAGALEIDDASCAAKSYPGFFSQFERLGFVK